ncbi:MAG: SDR family oxidoreductase [Ruminococcus sp.]|nr:SDR family oxidoreductase [Ruminococcus sp.]
MKTAVVTGGTRGIGKSISEMLLKNGFKVFAVYCNNQSCAEDFLKENPDGMLSVVKCDIGNPAEVSEVFSKFGGVDILINNAGIADINLLTDLSDEQIQRLISVNLTGAIFTTKAVLPYMVRQKSGNIINISSMWGETGASCETVYSAAKAGLIGFTKAMAKEVGPSGIRVNCITAGVIMTEMNKNLDAETLNSLRDETPLCKIGTPEDVANAVEYLISEKASFITGEILKVNGGLVI